MRVVCAYINSIFIQMISKNPGALKHIKDEFLSTSEHARLVFEQVM